MLCLSVKGGQHWWANAFSGSLPLYYFLLSIFCFVVSQDLVASVFVSISRPHSLTVSCMYEIAIWRYCMSLKGVLITKYWEHTQCQCCDLETKVSKTQAHQSLFSQGLSLPSQFWDHLVKVLVSRARRQGLGLGLQIFFLKLTRSWQQHWLELFWRW